MEKICIIFINGYLTLTTFLDIKTSLDLAANYEKNYAFFKTKFLLF